MKLFLEDYLTGIRKLIGHSVNSEGAVRLIHKYLNGVGLYTFNLTHKKRNEKISEYYFGTDTKVFVLEE